MIVGKLRHELTKAVMTYYGFSTVLHYYAIRQEEFKMDLPSSLTKNKNKACR